MSSFRQFLEEQSERVREEKSRAAEARDEWIAAVGRLNQEIASWLGPNVADGYLTVEEEPHELREVGIGAYRATGLLIGLGPREVRLKPVARYVAGSVASAGVIYIPRAYGRVDLTNGLSKYMLFRIETEPTDRWKIIKQDGFHMSPLERRTFEEALQDLLG